MKRQPVESTMLASVGYDPANETLELEFRSGGIYQYAGVPEWIYQELMSAGSMGRYIDTYITDEYPWTRVDGQPDSGQH